MVSENDVIVTVTQDLAVLILVLLVDGDGAEN